MLSSEIRSCITSEKACLNGLAALQGLMERAVVLGMGVQQQTATPALAELLSQYASILASQVCI